MSAQQDAAEIFGNAGTGLAGGLKDARSADGNDTRAIPAFVFGEELADLADRDPRVTVLTADLARSNRATDFAARHPDRFVNVGIAEKNMITMAAGMASAGLVPFAATFSAFAALLCCEQIRTDLAYSKLPVRIIGHHSGITFGFYGTSHHATEDLSIMRALAGLTVVAPADGAALAATMRASIAHEHPMYIRIGRGREPEVYRDGDLDDFALGRAISHERGTAGTVIAIGSMVAPSLTAVRELRESGLDVGLIDMHTIKPLDTDAVLEAAADSKTIITVEEHNVIGGLGAAVAETLTEAGAGVRLHRHGIKDSYSLIGPPTHLYTHYQLDTAGIASVIAQQLGHEHKATA